MSRKQRTIPGKTYPHRKKLKSIGCKWDETHRVWYAPTDKIYGEALAIVNDPPSEGELKKRALLKRHKAPRGIPLTQEQRDTEDLRAENIRLKEEIEKLRQENERLTHENEALKSGRVGGLGSSSAD